MASFSDCMKTQRRIGSGWTTRGTKTGGGSQSSGGGHLHCSPGSMGCFSYEAHDHVNRIERETTPFGRCAIEGAAGTCFRHSISCVFLVWMLSDFYKLMLLTFQVPALWKYHVLILFGPLSFGGKQPK